MATKHQKKQTKREKKAAKEAAREAARRAEQRRNRLTLAVLAVIVLVGGAIAVVTVLDERREQAAAEAELAELEAQWEAEEEAIENREVACGAEQPAAAGDEKPTYEDGPEQVLQEGLDYRAVVETSCGELVLDLHQDRAPETVNAFVFLAEEGFYDGLEIFRIAEPIAALQTGAGNNESSWQIGYTLPDELDLAAGDGYPVGSVAMANAGPDTAGSQFFFVYGEEFEEVHGEEPAFTRFADVVEGLDVLSELGAVGPVGEMLGAEVPAELLYMESVRIETG